MYKSKPASCSKISSVNERNVKIRHKLVFKNPEALEHFTFSREDAITFDSTDECHLMSEI